MPLEDNQVGFFTVYDGTFDTYIADFTKNIGEVFDLIFKFCINPPPSPCRKYLQEFIDYAAGANREPIGFYQAYPGLGVQDIHALIADSKTAVAPQLTSVFTRGSSGDQRQESMVRRVVLSQAGHPWREEEPATPTHPQKSALDLGDIQGFIVRGYRMPMVRHFVLTVGVPAKARELLGRLVSGIESDAPQITTAEDWHVGFAPGPGDDLAAPPRHKPDYCLNVGITWPGLVALEVKDRVPTLSFKSFGAFIAGAPARANLVGDTGASAPENWIDAFNSATIM